MELTKAKENLTSLLGKCNQSFSKFGIKTQADVYSADTKTFASRTDDDPFANVLCASITVYSSDAKDENEMCGFDIILRLNKKKQVDDDEFERETEDFKNKIREFLSELEETDSASELIRQTAKKEKEVFSAEMEGYTKKMKRAKITVAILSGLVLIALVFTVFALLLN